MCLEPLEMLRNLMKSKQKECSVVVFGIFAANKIYLKISKYIYIYIMPGIGKGTSLCFPYTSPSEKKNLNAY
jgi:hypothetical protein